MTEALPLYGWFLPLLRWTPSRSSCSSSSSCRQEVGRGSERVRPPRLDWSAKELDPNEETY